ncbi:MAG: hypothetical protein ACOY40_14830 [Bacillota bacterium]
MTLAIETDELTKMYGEKVGCEEICLSVPEGQIFGFLGPNGAGKSPGENAGGAFEAHQGNRQAAREAPFGYRRPEKKSVSCRKISATTIGFAAGSCWSSTPTCTG